MNILYLISAFLLLIGSYVYFSGADQAPSQEQPKAPVEAQKNQNSVISVDHDEIFKKNVRLILSKAYHVQKDQKSSQEVVSECALQLQGIIENLPDRSDDYVLAYRAIVSFLESLKEPSVYDSYIKMIDTAREINLLCDAFSWLAASMSNSRQKGFSLDSIKAAAKQTKVFDFVRIMVNRNIFPHLYKRQRDFLMPIMDLCENALSASNINNEYGPDDGPEMYADALHMNYNDARVFNQKILELREIPEGIVDRIDHSTDVVLEENIDTLTDYMRNVTSLKVIINDNLSIKPTQTMVVELVALADNAINKIKREQERRKQAI